MSAEFARYSVEDWVIWLGAGVSVGGSTRLPAGADLTWFAVRETCGAEVEERVKTLWRRMNAIAQTKDANDPLGWLPRLETILGEVAEAERSMVGGGFQFMRGFRSFANPPFNENHQLAAALMNAGATIVTPNFDLCIQSAYGAIAGAAPLRRERLGNAFRFVKEGGGPGEIWHIHGVADETASLGATVAMVKEGLPPEFEEMLRQRLGTGAALAFFGYSASDSFDVTPFFAQLDPGQVRGSHAAFVQHGAAGPHPCEPERLGADNPVPPNAYRLLSPFQKSAACVLDTTTALRSLADAARVTAAGAPAGTFDWSGEFLRAADLAGLPAVRDYLVCRLANVLGVNVNLLDPAALDGAESSVGRFDPPDYHGTMAVAYRPIRNARKERAHDEAVKRDEADMLGYLYAQGRLYEAREVAMSVPELLGAHVHGGELGWRAYTSMSVHCRIELNRRVRPFATMPAGNELAHVHDLVEIARRLGDRPYRGVKFINQVATARRFVFLFEALLNGREDRETMGSVLRLYGDAASVGGFISTWRDIAFARFFLARYHRRWRMADSALAAAWRSYRLARAAGDRAGTRRAAMLAARIAAFVV